MSQRIILHALGALVVCAGAMACTGGNSGNGGSPTSPGGPPAGGSSASCRTVASSQRAVRTFASGQTTTLDTTCSHNTSSNDVTCLTNFTDTSTGTGTINQVSRFASRSDIVDEAAVNPPLARSSGTTTVVTVGGVSLTTTVNRSYDAQRRLASTVEAFQTPIGLINTTTTYSAWDSSGRPTAGTSTGTAGTFPVTITYDNANRTATRDLGVDVCTVTHDQNGIIIREVCRAESTNVTVNATQQICK